MKELSPKEIWDRILNIIEKPILGNNLGAWVLALAVGAGVFLGIRIADLMRSLLIVAALLQGGLWATLILEKWLEYRISSQKGATVTANANMIQTACGVRNRSEMSE